MAFQFCSKLAIAEGEPLDGSAPEKDLAIFIPAQKTIWHLHSPVDFLNKLLNESEFSRCISNAKNPLICFYNPKSQVLNQIFVANSSSIMCFSEAGKQLNRKINHIYAVCTDGKKDACCSKFGIPIAKAFTKALQKKKNSITFETSHIGGCRFAATALCFPSGNSYGRINLQQVAQIIRAEEIKSVVSSIYRGNIFVSELQCWIIRHCVEQFGIYPTISQTEVIRESNVFHISIKPRTDIEYKFNLLHTETTFKLFSGCANLESGRIIKRSIYTIIT